eukprot:TRINITY_DN38906_c0_g1_i1.p1 TRINITY_DN38906_c0_g1~~TRINITY_DN38906_c0_g1_i1.p1  ORF type:complete len:303 (-),score=62.35 TRINITY_DN38906_c0_g1_i1:3-911(-)
MAQQFDEHMHVDWLSLGDLFALNVLDFVPTKILLECWASASKHLHAVLQTPDICVTWRWSVLAPPDHANGPKHGWFLEHRALAKLSGPQRLHAALCFRRGLSHYENRELLEALRWYGEALQLAPGHDVVMTRLADTLFSLDSNSRATDDGSTIGKSPFQIRAKELYQRAHKIDPSNSYALNGLALFEEDSEVMLRAALELNPENSYALANLGGKLATTLEGNPEAIELLSKALTLNPRLFYARSSLLHALWYSGGSMPSLPLLQLALGEERAAELMQGMIGDPFQARPRTEDTEESSSEDDG